MMMNGKHPKEYSIPSRSYPITVDEAGRTLIEAQEIKDNKPLHRAVVKHLKRKKKAIDKAV